MIFVLQSVWVGKWVPVQPSSFAKLFIISTKPSVEPPTWVAMAEAASFPEYTRRQCRS